MSVLITGGCGMIGSTMARMLVERGEQVWIFDRQGSGSRMSGIEDRVKIIRGELGNFSHVLEAVKESTPRAIFLVAARDENCGVLASRRVVQRHATASRPTIRWSGAA